jgi:nitrogen fixation-related uncharacterized protein
MRKRILLAMMIPITVLIWLLGWLLFWAGSQRRQNHPEKNPKAAIKEVAIEITEPVWKESYEP